METSLNYLGSAKKSAHFTLALLLSKSLTPLRYNYNARIYAPGHIFHFDDAHGFPPKGDYRNAKTLGGSKVILSNRKATVSIRRGTPPELLVLTYIQVDFFCIASLRSRVATRCRRRAAGKSTLCARCCSRRESSTHSPLFFVHFNLWPVRGPPREGRECGLCMRWVV
jgi:hypothetical protein